MAPSDAQYVIEELRYRCDKILNGDREDGDIDALMDEIAGGYSFPLKVTGSSSITKDRTVDGVRKIRGWLGYHMGNIASHSSDNVATAYAVANTSVNVDLTVSNTISQVWRLPDGVLTTDEKTELTNLLNDLENAKGEDQNKVKKAAKAIGDWMFDKAIEAVPAVMPYVSQVIQSAFGG